MVLHIGSRSKVQIHFLPTHQYHPDDMETYNGTSGDGELKYNVDNQREAVMDRAIASSLPTEETPDPAVEEGTDALAKQPRDGPQDLCRRDLDADSGMEGTTEAETLDNAASNSGGKQESLKAPGTVTEGEVAFLSPSVANAQGILIANDSTQVGLENRMCLI